MMEILQAIEDSGFAMFVKESSTTYTATLAFHTIGLAFLVGISVGTSLRILGFAPSLPLAPMLDFFPLMYVGFWINALTGVVLLSLYPTKFLTDGTMYIKLGAVAIAMITIRVLRAHVFGDGADPGATAGSKRARRLAGTLLGVWLVAITAGRVTAYTLPTKLETAAAVLVAVAVMLLVGTIAARGLAWTRSRGQDV